MMTVRTKVGIVIVACSFGLGCRRDGDQVSLSSLSPDGSYRVRLVEHDGRLDRNFAVLLESTRTRTTTNLFESPDEGRPIGSERVVWNRDSSQFILLGKRFTVVDQERNDDGESLYLLCRLSPLKLWCNASQQDQLENFRRTQLTNTTWAGSF